MEELEAGIPSGLRRRLGARRLFLLHLPSQLEQIRQGTRNSPVVVVIAVVVVVFVVVT